MSEPNAPSRDLDKLAERRVLLTIEVLMNAAAGGCPVCEDRARLELAEVDAALAAAEAGMAVANA